MGAVIVTGKESPGTQLIQARTQDLDGGTNNQSKRAVQRRGRGDIHATANLRGGGLISHL